MAKHLAEVDILGSSFKIRSSESPEHMAQLIEHFSSRVAEARRAMPQADSLRVAIVSGLNITDELFKACKEAAESGRDSYTVAQIATRLIDVIDQTLSQEDDAEGPSLDGRKAATDAASSTAGSPTGVHTENPGATAG